MQAGGPSEYGVVRSQGGLLLVVVQMLNGGVLLSGVVGPECLTLGVVVVWMRLHEGR